MTTEYVRIIYKLEAGPGTGETVNTTQHPTEPLPEVGDFAFLQSEPNLAGYYRIASRCFVYDQAGALSAIEITVDGFQKPQ